MQFWRMPTTNRFGYMRSQLVALWECNHTGGVSGGSISLA
jgi:hypothetical protein